MHSFGHRFGHRFGCHGQEFERAFMGRRGFMGGFGRDFMGGFGPGGGGFRYGRALGHGDLRVVILALLAEKPRHGYEIIKALEERSGGVYSPSPGVVYPTLTYLEELGYATVEAQGSRKLYAITESGRAFLAENHTLAEALLGRLAQLGLAAERMKSWFGWQGQAGSGRTAEAPGAPSGDVGAALQAIKSVLAERADASPEEERRIAEILERAAAELRRTR